ncbi:MAG: serine/threonine-protein phosphatase [Bacteroidetes bacterium]|nr:MAG: serine/threonine-protein phosphatase [Bacteroidota bacterium]
MHNVYNTNDPEKLLDLKRLEADALLDILRTINQSELKIERLCRVAQNLLRAQLGVRKMAFFYEEQGRWVQGIRLGFSPFSEEAMLEFTPLSGTSPVTATLHPVLYQRGVEYIVPITNRGEASAFFLVAEFADSEVEARSDLIFIETLGHILAVAIQNRQLFQEKMAQEFLRKELEVAETIQQQLLISDFSRFDELDVYALNLAHHGVGGDFYDIIPKENGSIFLCIADVSGKGIGAALLMSNLQANLRALCARYQDLPTIIRELNQILYGITTGEKFVTLFLARVDPSTQTMTFVNAGHNYPVFVRNGVSSRLRTGCLLLGIMPDLTIEEETQAYGAGDLLFMFTDGVVEQTNATEEMFGSDRIVQELEHTQGRTAREVVEQLQATLSEFSGTEEANDDITMLGVKFL